MRILVMLISALMMASLAEAKPKKMYRYNLAKLTCGQAKQLVKKNGAVIFTYEITFLGNKLFKKFVKNAYYCDSFETVKRGYYDAKDGDCVLKTCEINHNDGGYDGNDGGYDGGYDGGGASDGGSGGSGGGGASDGGSSGGGGASDGGSSDGNF